MNDLTSDVLGLAVLLVAVIIIWRATAAVRRKLNGAQPENVLTVVAAVIATIVQADGMWIFFRDIVPVPVYLRVLTFAFLEVALFASGLRARRNIKETPEHTAGVDGMAVWALAAISGTLASTTAGSFRGALLRLTAAAVAAWLWERGLSGERRRARKEDNGRGRRINWRITPERVLVLLGIAEADEKTAGDVDAHRRLTRVALAVQHVRELRAAGATPWRQARARRRLSAATRAAVAHARLAQDEQRQLQLLAQIAVLSNAQSLAGLTLAAPWDRTPALDAPAAAPAMEASQDVPDGDAQVLAWLTGQAQAGDVPEPDPMMVEAAALFAEEVRRGKVPGIKRIQKVLRVGQDRAYEIQAYLGIPEHGQGA